MRRWWSSSPSMRARRSMVVVLAAVEAVDDDDHRFDGAEGPQGVADGVLSRQRLLSRSAERDGASTSIARTGRDQPAEPGAAEWRATRARSRDSGRSRARVPDERLVQGGRTLSHALEDEPRPARWPTPARLPEQSALFDPGAGEDDEARRRACRTTPPTPRAAWPAGVLADELGSTVVRRLRAPGGSACSGSPRGRYVVPGRRGRWRIRAAIPPRRGDRLSTRVRRDMATMARPPAWCRLSAASHKAGAASSTRIPCTPPPVTLDLAAGDADPEERPARPDHSASGDPSVGCMSTAALSVARPPEDGQQLRHRCP